MIKVQKNASNVEVVILNIKEQKKNVKEKRRQKDAERKESA